MRKYLPQICLYFITIVAMIGLAVFVENDHVLTVIYLGVITITFVVKKERADLLILSVGFLGTLIGEYLFVSTGIETFNRTSFMGIFPLWLPFLWSYIFLAMKRVSWTLAKEYL